MNVWETLENFKGILGAEALLDALCKALGDWELEDNLNYIARCYELETIEE